MDLRHHISLTGIVGALIILQGCGSDATEVAPGPSREPVRVEGFSTPESVLHDEERDVYLVTNINGSPIDKDDNGFIARISPDGEVLDAKWIDGASSEVTLNGPKGMALSGGKLYVADIDTVRVFGAADGAPVANIEVPGATFLNDVTALPDGRIVVSDSGLTLEDGSFTATGSDALIVIDQEGRVTRVLADPEMPRPNGVEWGGDEVWMCYFGSNTLDAFALSGTRNQQFTLPAGQLDGLVRLDERQFLVSSWETSTVYKVDVSKGGSPVVSEVATGLTAPADIGFDAARGRMMVPLFNDNVVVLLDLE